MAAVQRQRRFEKRNNEQHLLSGIETMPHEGAGGYDLHYADTCEYVFNVTDRDDDGRGIAE